MTASLDVQNSSCERGGPIGGLGSAVGLADVIILACLAGRFACRGDVACLSTRTTTSQSEVQGKDGCRRFATVLRLHQRHPRLGSVFERQYVSARKYRDSRSWARETPTRVERFTWTSGGSSERQNEIRALAWQQSTPLSAPVIPRARVRFPGPRANTSGSTELSSPSAQLRI